MVYDFDSIPDRRNSDSFKWNFYSEDVLPMWVADMDFLSPEPVVRALRERVEHGVYGYPLGLKDEPGELPGFRQLIVERMADRYNWDITAEDLIFLPGVIVGFNLACHAVAAPAGGVLVQTPVYPHIFQAAETTGCLPQEMELTRAQDGSYSVDWDLFTASMTRETRLFILNNPHNPVGKVFQQEELERVAEICLQRDVVICSDEIHSDLTFSDHRHVPIAALDPQVADNTITLIAPTKTYNLAGLHCSIAIIQNPELRRLYLEAKQGLVSWVNLMGLAAGQAAYKYGDEWLAQLIVYLQENRDILSEYLPSELPRISMFKPHGTYLAWLDCREAGIQGNAGQFFLNRAKVAMNDGATFGRGGEGFVRLNFGCPRSMLLEALQRMQFALTAHVT